MQQINFYKSLSKPGLTEINGRRAKKILGAALLVFLGIFILQCAYLTFEKIHLLYLKNSEKKLTMKIETLLQTSPKIKNFHKLENTMIAFSEKINQKTAFINEITRYNEQSMQFKPSEYLNELSDAIIANVWLTQFSFEESGHQITLSGFTMSTAQLTAFITKLQKEAHFKNRPFNKVAITNSDKQEQMAFVISTQDKQDNKKTWKIFLRK